MYLTFELPQSTDTPSPDDRVTVFGITDFQVESDGVRLFWPYGSEIDDCETVIPSTISSGGGLESLDYDAFADIIVDDSYAKYTIIVETPNNKYRHLSCNQLKPLLTDITDEIDMLCGAGSIAVITDDTSYPVPTMTELPDLTTLIQHTD